MSRHTGFYKDFGRPLAKCLLMASATYMLLHVTWWTLETAEMKVVKSKQIGNLNNHMQKSILDSSPPK